jgi:hypothetical protein
LFFEFPSSSSSLCIPALFSRIEFFALSILEQRAWAKSEKFEACSINKNNAAALKRRLKRRLERRLD